MIIISVYKIAQLNFFVKSFFRISGKFFRICSPNRILQLPIRKQGVEHLQQGVGGEPFGQFQPVEQLLPPLRRGGGGAGRRRSGAGAPGRGGAGVRPDGGRGRGAGSAGGEGGGLAVQRAAGPAWGVLRALAGERPPRRALHRISGLRLVRGLRLPGVGMTCCASGRPSWSRAVTTRTPSPRWWTR